MPYRDRIVDLTGLNNNKNIQAPAGEGKTLRATVGNKGNNQLYSLQSKRIGEKDEYTDYQNMEDEYTRYDPEENSDQFLINSGATIIDSRIEQIWSLRSSNSWQIIPVNFQKRHRGKLEWTYTLMSKGLIRYIHLCRNG